MTKEINLREIRGIPKLYLFNYLNLGGASMYANFIKSVYEDSCFTRPHSVKFLTYGEYHFVRADGCYLDLDRTTINSIPFDYNGYNGLVDMLFKDSVAAPKSLPNPLLPFEGIALMIYCAEWCLIDISADAVHFRQAFYQGQAITPCERRTADNFPPDAPCIQMQFTLDSPLLFQSKLVTLAQLKQAFLSLRKYRLIPTHLRLTSLRAIESGFQAKIK